MTLHIHAILTHTHNTHRNLVIGGDDITPDSVEEKETHTEYRFTWFTNGYTSTKSGQRLDLRIAFLFEGAELATTFQVSPSPSPPLACGHVLARPAMHEWYFEFLVLVSQVKFYSIVKGNHLTWGTPINRIEVEGKGEFGTGSTGAAAFQTLTPTNVSFF